MAQSKNDFVRVHIRNGVDLYLLVSAESPLKVPCGSIGRSIAQRVLEGGGVASIPLSDIRMAIDTQDGVNAIMDNFNLEDPKTLRPLLFELLR